MVNAQHPTVPDYPEYLAVLATAEQRVRDAGRYVNPADIRPGGRYDQITLRHTDDWCSAVTGIYPWWGWHRLNLTQTELLAAADAAGVDPPLPQWILDRKAAAAQARAAEQAREQQRAAERQARIDQDLEVWSAARAAATVKLEVYLNPTARARHGTREQLGHAVPASDCFSGTRKTRLHRAWRALCETENRSRPLRLEDSPSPDAPVTCVSCLTWAPKVRTEP